MACTKGERELVIETNYIYEGDCLNVLKTFPGNSIDSIVTDPPYGLSFMGKKWDYDVPSQAIWEECLRVLKPGGHLLAFAGTRTQHRMAVRIEDAGFEIRDMIAWVYGSGFPKSLNISKAIDKMAGSERKPILDEEGNQVWTSLKQGKKSMFDGGKERPATYPATYWEGWGTALKPALEPITVARKPISEKTIAENVLKWNTGGINIDGCRVEVDVSKEPRKKWEEKTGKDLDYKIKKTNTNWGMLPERNFGEQISRMPELGRFPANLIHDGSEEVLSGFPETVSKWGKSKEQPQGNGFIGFAHNAVQDEQFIGDSGSASRFFYCAKASKSERNEGCEGLEEKVSKVTNMDEMERTDGTMRELALKRNDHPTVKPIALMEYLVKLVTPKGGIVLDPFTGSGSTLIAAEKLGFNYIGIELNPEYIQITNARLAAKTQLRLSI